MWVVRVALQRPYSFVVLALLIAIFGVLAALNTPTDIFPSLNIPVVSVVWTDNGLLPNDMSGREPASLAPEPGRAADQVLRRRLSAPRPPTAQSAALEAEGLAIALHTRQLTADIGLMLALGGGWMAPPEPRAKPGLAPYLAE